MYIVRTLARQLKTLRGMTVVHVGAHTGEEAAQYAFWGATRVIWVEADPNLIPRLTAHLDAQAQTPQAWLARLTGAPRTQHTVLHALVADSDDVEMEFHLFANDGASNSIFRKGSASDERFPWLEETGEVLTLRSRRLDSLLEENGIAPEEVDVLALDIQGAELLCLKGAPRLVGALKYLETEIAKVPYYDGGVLFDDLNAWLEGQGFRLRTWLRRPMMNAVYTKG
ncbi:MAG: FkbM family methyltransferase [Pseudomonadota bacterium]